MPRRKAHPGTIERRGGSLRIILYAAGKRHSFTLATTDRREAVEFAKRKDAELQRGCERQRLGLPGSQPFSALLDKFTTERLPLLAPNTQDTYSISLAGFRTFFVGRLGDPKVEQIRAGHVKEFLNWRRSNRRQGVGTLSNRTVQKDRTVLHAVFAFAEELEWREGNPVAKVSSPRGDPRDPVILDEAQYSRLLEACGTERPMLRLYILTLGETGARCESEALYLRWEDVDFEEGFLRIASGREGHRTKSGKGRWVPMTATLRQAMRQHFARFRFAVYQGQQTAWVFHHTRRRRRAQSGDRITTLRNSFTSAVKRANLPAALHQHDLRHRRVTTWLAEGKNPVHVKEAVGHADLRTTMGYTHLAKEHLRVLVEDGAATAAFGKA
jgi:site-specific recombinase XerD